MRTNLMKSNNGGRPRKTQRKGTIIVLAAFLLAVLVAAAAFTIDLAYMHSARSDLQHATDAAARAASNAIGDGTDLTQARQLAISIAADNHVAGKPLVLEDQDIVFGKSVLAADGSFTFDPNVSPLNAVRVSGKRIKGSASGPVTLFLGHMLGRKTFEPQIHAAAARIDRDIVIVADRSGSMAWDESGVDWSYPPPLDQNSWSVNYVTPPHSADSRWAGLEGAVTMFVAAVGDTPEEELLALVSYSNAYTYNGVTAVTSTIHQQLTPNHALIPSAVQSIGNQPIIGGTNISAGIQDGIQVLSNPNTVRSHAFKVMVLMTDGVWNAGQDPAVTAQDAAALGIVIHTITFSAGANKNDMKAVANATGGRYYHAPTSVELEEAFADIAYSVPVVLIQ